ncbi:hypothetical protein D3C73_901830 [compost metagenome]
MMRFAGVIILLRFPVNNNIWTWNAAVIDISMARRFHVGSLNQVLLPFHEEHITPASSNDANHFIHLGVLYGYPLGGSAHFNEVIR